jgi:hypothetical protein
MPDGTTPVTVIPTPEAIELLPLEQIMRKESTFLGHDVPENKAIFDGLLVKHVATRMVAAVSSWREVGKALSYMVRNEIPQRLGYESIEKWIQESLRPELAAYACGDIGVEALLQWRNYWEAFEFISEVEPIAGQNLLDAQAGPADYRKMLSWAANPQKKLPGVDIETSEDFKDELLRVTAEAISHISVEEPDLDYELPPGKSACDVAKSLRKSALNMMQNEMTKAIAKRIAQDVNDQQIKEHRYYEMLGSYEYFLTEEVECPRTGAVTEKTRKVKFDFKGDSESDRWVEVMEYDPEEKEVYIRPWIYFTIPVEDRPKHDMREDGTLNKAVSICMLNLKDESRVGLTQEDLDNQAINLTLPVQVSHRDWGILCKAFRDKKSDVLGDKIAEFLESLAQEAIKQKEELSAKKNAEAAQAIA